MPVENKFERCEPDDPNRCQASGDKGQCTYKAIDGFQYCPRHNASRKAEAQRESLRNYRLGKFQARVEEFADSDKVKCLREEIGITRILLEEIINQCNTGVDMIMYSNKISDLVTRIDKLVNSCHRLEQSTGMLLDKQALQQLADNIITIITKHVDDDAAGAIATEIMETLLTAGKDA